MIRRFWLSLLGALLLASVNVSAQDPSIAGTLASTTCPGSGCISLTNLGDRQMATVEVSGTWTGSFPVEITASWVSVGVYNANTKAFAATITANGTYQVPMQGANAIRVRAQTLSSGTASVRLSAGQGDSSFVLPVGAATETTLAALNAKVTAVNTGATVISSSALPTGAATETTQAATLYTFGQNAMSPGSQKATLVGSIDAIAGTFTQMQSRNTTPSGGEAGLVVRNIPSGTQAVSAASLPLPSGAATAANQTTELASLASIDGKLPSAAAADRTTAAAPSSTRLSDGSSFYKATTPSDTQPISAAALPLPAGAATAAAQATAQASLDDIGTTNTEISIAAQSLDANLVATTAVSGAGVPTRAIFVGANARDDPGILEPLESNTAAPGSSDRGLVVRNIPSGTQPVSAAALPLPSGSAAIVAGTLSATTSAAALASSTAISKVAIQNRYDNTVDILCGNASAQPILLRPGEGMSLDINNLNLAFCKTASGTATVAYVAR